MRALVRPSSDVDLVDELEDRGIEIVVGDLRAPETLRGACAGLSTVVCAATAVGRRQPTDTIDAIDRCGVVSLVETAAAAGIESFVQVSCATDRGADDPLARAEHDVERCLAASGLAYTILRSTGFMERWLAPTEGFDLAARRARLYGAGDRKTSWVSAADVAEFVALVLDGPKPNAEVIDLGGPDALSPLEVARLAEDIGGRPIDIERIPIEALRRARATATDDVEASLIAQRLFAAEGHVVPMAATLERLPVRLTPMREFLRGVL